mmetsp:Transcript_72444/g.234122  ORF Transcript_72444/g.234122 Transcript_72444/m.234122 type:complete len:333 (+) Transcript_72444:133-1131(+)
MHAERERLRQQMARESAENAEKMSQEAERKEAERKRVWEAQREDILRQAQKPAMKDEEERRQEEREEYPMPEFLKSAGGTEQPNWAIVGDFGQGKSALVNLFLGTKVAQVGSTQTTMQPTPYNIEGCGVKIWDLPGAGTKTFPKETYIREVGLRYFDFVFVVSAGRWKEHDFDIIKELDKHRVPHFVVRTKVDLDIQNELEDNDKEPGETIQRLRQDCEKQGLANAYLITTRLNKFKSHAALYDNQRLQQDMERAAGRARGFTTSSAGQRGVAAPYMQRVRAPGRVAQMSQPVATPAVWTPVPLVVAPRILAHKPLHSTRSFCALARAMRRK